MLDTTEKLRRYLAARRAARRSLPLSATNRKARMTGRVVQNSGDPDWFTPPIPYISAIKRVLGQIDLDPASCAHANATVGATRFYSREDDGLSLPWYGRVFCNPPYCRPEVDRFTDCMIWSYTTGRIEAGILLVNSDTSTRRWHKAFEADDSTCLVNHRIAFIPGNDAAQAMVEAKKGNRNAQAFFYFGPNAVLFDKVFAGLGSIARHHKSVTDNRTTCVVCGGAFIARHGAKTCSAKCRQSAYRRRVTDTLQMQGRKRVRRRCLVWEVQPEKQSAGIACTAREGNQPPRSTNFPDCTAVYFNLLTR